MDDNERTRIAGAEIIARYMHRTVEDDNDPALVALREYFAIAARIAERLRRTTQQNVDSRESDSRDTIPNAPNDHEV